MSVNIAVPRDTPKEAYRYLRRWARCSARALEDTGVSKKHLEDMIIYGTSYYTQEEQEIVAARALQLFAGLKP